MDKMAYNFRLENGLGSKLCTIQSDIIPVTLGLNLDIIKQSLDKYVTLIVFIYLHLSSLEFIEEISEIAGKFG